MRKFLLAVCALCAGITHAQSAETPNPFKRFYANFGADFTDLQYSKKNAYIGFAYLLKDDASIGLTASYKEAPDQVTSNAAGGQTTTSAPFGGHNLAFQLQFNHDWSRVLRINTDKFDIYTGLNLGMTFQQAEYTQFSGPFTPPFGARNVHTVNNTSVDLGGQVGIRYFVYKNIGIHVEANANSSVAGDRYNIGIDPRRIELRTGLTYRF